MSDQFLLHAGAPQTRIDAFYLARKNYHFAHRVWAFAADDRMNFVFDDDIVAGDKPPLKRMRATEFQELSERTATAEQVCGVQYGSCFIAMFDILEAAFGDGAVPKGVPDEVKDVATLVWAVRNAFAHKVGTPVWNVQDELRRRKLKIEHLTVDLSQLHGLPVHPDQLGGALSVERVWVALNASMNALRDSKHSQLPPSP